MSYGNDEDARQGLAEDDLLDEAEVDTLVREAISLAVGDTPFQHDKINQWTNGIIEGCLKKLAALAKPFKYVVSCNLSQKVGAGLHSACTVRWNDKTDSNIAVQWENKTILVLAAVYWLAV